MQLLLAVVGGYLCGSLPSGVWLARTAGIDVQRVGSGNIGATNVARTAGWRLGLLTLLADVAKGALPVLFARALGDGGWITAAAGLAAFLGHLFPVTLRLRGGKGVATALGVLAVLAPTAALAALAVFAAVFAVSRYVSLASMCAAAVAPLVVLALGPDTPVLVASAAMGLLIALRHRDNLTRLRAGTEHRF